MKVQAVSFGFNTKNIPDKKENYPFMYTMAKPKSDEQLKKFGIITGFLALCAVCVTLFNLKNSRKFPKDIVEISDMEKGLNKLPNLNRTVDDLKRNVLYPLKCASLSKNSKFKNFKTGVIFLNEKDQSSQNVIQALIEHAKELEISTVEINNVISTQNEKGEIVQKELKRNELVKSAFYQIKKAAERFENEGKFTVINLGDIEKYTNLRTVKSRKSRIEKLLEATADNKYPGVMWIAESNNPKKLPLFFNGLKSVFITKIMD